MGDDLRQRINEYMGKCPYCTIATASTGGEPSASSVFFNSAGMNIYFNTWKDSQKAKNIQANPRVSIVMQQARAPKTDKEISGIQYSGKARILSDDEYGEVPGPVMARHRVFNSVSAGNSVVIKVVPVKIYLVDYSRGFRHRDLFQP